MYEEEEFEDEASVEFEEDAVEAETASQQHAAAAAAEVPLGDDADSGLEAYLADADAEQPAGQPASTSVEASPVTMYEEEEDQQLGEEADAALDIVEPASTELPLAATTTQPDDGYAAVSQHSSSHSLPQAVKGPADDAEEEVEDVMESPAQATQPLLAAILQPAPPPAAKATSVPPAADEASAARTSNASSSAADRHSHSSSVSSQRSSHAAGISTCADELTLDAQPTDASAAPASGHSSTAHDSPSNRASTSSMHKLQDNDSSCCGSSPNNSSPMQARVKARPASASPAVRRSESSTRQQQQQELQEQQQQYGYSPPRTAGSCGSTVVPVANWTVNDVCDWVDGLGLCQYRKKFMHNVVGGALLLRLNDTLLRTELGIGPLGHRVLIQDGVAAIAAADLQQAASAALAGVSPEDYSSYEAAGNCSSPSMAAAVLVAGLIALKAGQRCGSSSSAHNGGRRSPGLARAGSGGFAAAGSPDRGAAVGDGGSPGVRRAQRPSSAPCKGKSPGRSPSPVDGRCGSPSPGALGPAAGRISVYEQRAKILFELGRAQARAATTAGTACEVAGVAQLAQKEVAALQGQLADLDKRNKLAVQHASGSVDTKGIIPWKHTGSGTKAADPHPERIARPWDPPGVELTFHPRISARSQALMSEARGAEGAGGFLDRLDNDMRRREAKQKELEKRYYSSSGAGGADAARAAKAAAADLAVLSGFFSQRGWAALAVPSSSSSGGGGVKLTEEDYRELDSQLDEVVETYSEELGLGKSDSRQCHAALAARGPKKLAALVAAVRTVQFMDRYHADLSTRGSRLQQLQDNYFQHQAVSSTGGRMPAVPLTPEQKDAASAVKWFRSMGWQEAADADDCDELLAALVQRARHYKTEAEKLHEKERAAATASGAAAVAAHATASMPHPSIAWAAAPWSVDGLGGLMQAVLDARRAASEETAAKAAANSKPSAVDATLGKPAPTGSPGAAAGAPAAPPVTAATLEAAAASGADTLQLSVRLLAGMRWAGLDQLDAARGKAKKLAVYRALRTQQFLAFTAADLSAREAKTKALLREFEDSRRGKLVSRAELDNFYERLQADGQRRLAELEKARADKAEREAKALALVSIKPGFSRRPRSAK